MARIYGKPSDYLIWMDWGNFIASIFYSLILLLIWWIVFIKNFYTLFNPYGFIVLLISFGPMFIYTYRRMNVHRRDSDKFFRGRMAEIDIWYELKKLPKSYAVFHGIKFEYGDVDFVVIGPTGIFTIEVKSIWGLITRDKLHSVKIFGKDIIKQVRGEAQSIYNLINKKMNLQIDWVNPILVFSSPWVSLKFWLNKVEGVQVVQKKLLNKAILDRPEKLSFEQVEALEAEFLKKIDNKKTA